MRLSWGGTFLLRRIRWGWARCARHSIARTCRGKLATPAAAAMPHFVVRRLCLAQATMICLSGAQDTEQLLQGCLGPLQGAHALQLPTRTSYGGPPSCQHRASSRPYRIKFIHMLMLYTCRSFNGGFRCPGSSLHMLVYILFGHC